MNNKRACILLFALLSLIPFVQNAAAVTLTSTPIANTIIDLGQTTTLSTVISGGNVPYTGNWVWTAPNTLFAGSPTNTIPANIFIGGIWNSVITMNTYATQNVIFTFNGVPYPVNTAAGSTIFGYWTFQANVVDNAIGPGANAVTIFGNVFVANTPAVTAPIPSNVLLDAGQYVVYNTILSGGTGPFTVNLVKGGLVVNSVNGVSVGTIVFGVNIPAQGTDVFNVIATDLGTTTPYVFNSPQNTITVSAAPTATVSPTSNTLDLGQTLKITANIIGGTSAYTYNFLVYNSLGGLAFNALFNSNTFTSNAFLFNALQFTGAQTGNFYVNTIITDSASKNVIFSPSTNSVIKVNVAPTATVSPTSNTLDLGQTLKITANIIGGTSAYTYNFLVYNSLGGLAFNALFNSNTFTSNAFLFNALQFTGAQTGNFYVNTIITDSASTNVIFSPSTNSVIKVNAAPTATIAPTSNTLDLGQTLLITANIIGGTSAYTYNFLVYNSLGGLAFNALFNGNTFTSNAFLFNALKFTGAQTGNFYVNTIITDSASTNVIFSPSTNSVIKVNVAPTATVSPTSNTLNLGQTLLITANIIGGTSAYTYNFLVYNSLGGLAFNALFNGNTFTSNAFLFNALKFTGAQTGNFYANVIIKDSASTNVIFSPSTNSVIKVNAAPTITLNSIASIGTVTNSIIYGNTVTINALVTGGTGPFTFAWTLNGVSATNTAIGTTGSSNVLTLPAVGNYVFNVIATDTGTSYTLPQATNTIIVSMNASLSGAVLTYTRTTGGSSTSQTTSTSTSYSAGYYDIATISFNGVNTINGQAPWTVYLNGALASTTNSLYQFSEQAQAGTYAFTFNNAGNNNYTAYSFSVTLNVSQLSSSGSGVGAQPYATTTVATTSTTVPTVSTTTIVQIVNGLASFNASIGAPVEVNITGAPAYITIYASSTGGTAVNIIATNVTSNSPPAPAGYTKLLVLNITLSTAGNITVNATLSYPCSLPSIAVAPYILKNGTWHAITPFTVNESSCSVTFTVPNDPIVGLFVNSAAVTTFSTTVAPTTVAPTPTPSYSSTYTIAIIIVIVVIAIAVVAYVLMSRGKKKGRRHPVHAHGTRSLSSMVDVDKRGHV